MSSHAQREVAELLKSLGRPAEAISANSQIDQPTIKAWLRTGLWPGPRQKTLFDASGWSPRPSTTQPAAATDRNSGLNLFAR